ncbi:4-oxalocrotonate tautomerase family protein [Nostoc sp. FACHB-888]|uniref:tautomerase family protein n=1 Tax=Nostoc sp. FACHB-888 TaxID=2692842 RepID=UPI001683D9E4|nr:4-oxalocrotonate tautomerase family protein [Nostoc sp. FACHB-888]MBD2247488.1 4-oxalocrotonate tautomerase family protein [Nostoc sp. FACHB-888]
MPYVNVKLIDDSLSPEAKAEVIRQITDVFVQVLNKNPETTFVVIEEVNIDNWGVAGQTVRARQAAQRSQINAQNS